MNQAAHPAERVPRALAIGIDIGYILSISHSGKTGMMTICVRKPGLLAVRAGA